MAATEVEKIAQPNLEAVVLTMSQNARRHLLVLNLGSRSEGNTLRMGTKRFAIPAFAADSTTNQESQHSRGVHAPQSFWHTRTLRRWLEVMSRKRGCGEMPRTRHLRFPSKRGATDSKAGLLTCRSSRYRLPSHPSWNSGIGCRTALCLQWRDRAGFSPASLFTHPL